MISLFSFQKTNQCMIIQILNWLTQYEQGGIKGTVSRDFLLQVFFSWITFPQAPKNNIRVNSNFFENSRRYLQVKVHHRYQTAQMVYSGFLGETDSWKKTRSRKSRGTVTLNHDIRKQWTRDMTYNVPVYVIMWKSWATVIWLINKKV